MSLPPPSTPPFYLIIRDLFLCLFLCTSSSLQMPPKNDSAGSRGPRSRRSIAHVPRSKMTPGLDKENTTTDITAMQPPGARAKPAIKDKKSRSKSLGPGGLDALQNSNGNRRKVASPAPQSRIEVKLIGVSLVDGLIPAQVDLETYCSCLASTKHPVFRGNTKTNTTAQVATECQ